jgi:hypothetical protein
MGKVAFIFALAVVTTLVGGCLFLAYWNPHVSQTRVEKVLPDTRFPR